MANPTAVTSKTLPADGMSRWNQIAPFSPFSREKFRQLAAPVENTTVNNYYGDAATAEDKSSDSADDLDSLAGNDIDPDDGSYA